MESDVFEPVSRQVDAVAKEVLETLGERLPAVPKEIDFAELEDGSLVDLVEDPLEPTRLRLAIWKDQRIQFADQLEYKGQLLRPLQRTGILTRHLRFPRGAKPFKSVRALLEEVQELLRACVSLRDCDSFVLAAFVLSTWLADKLPTAPYVAVIGLPQSGKTTLLETLRLVCRRPLLTADITPAALYALCSRLAPTLLIDESGSHRSNSDLRHLLRAGTTRNTVAIRHNQTFTAFGPKVISSLQPPDDPALNSRCIFIPMCEMDNASLARPNSAEIQERAANLQDKLLQFRFEKYHTLLTPDITGAEKLRLRARDLLSCLAAPLAEDAEACSLLLRFFEEEAVAPDPLDSEENAVLRVLFEYAREDPDFYTETGLVPVSDVKDEVNRMLEKTRGHRQLKPRKVGAILTSFGFIKHKRTDRGYMITLNRWERRRVHHLVCTYGVEGPCPLKIHPNCPLCAYYKL